MSEQPRIISDFYAEFDPTSEEINAIIEARRVRKYQRKSRGDKQSASDTAQDIMMILAWEAGEVSEGVITKVMQPDGDRVAMRERRMKAIAMGRALAHGLRILGDKRP